MQAAASTAPATVRRPQPERCLAGISFGQSLLDLLRSRGADPEHDHDLARSRRRNRLCGKLDAVPELHARAADGQHAPLNTLRADVGSDAICCVECIDRQTQRGGTGLMQDQDVDRSHGINYNFIVVFDNGGSAPVCARLGRSLP